MLGFVPSLPPTPTPLVVPIPSPDHGLLSLHTQEALHPQCDFGACARERKFVSTGPESARELPSGQSGRLHQGGRGLPHAAQRSPVLLPRAVLASHPPEHKRYRRGNVRQVGPAIFCLSFFSLAPPPPPLFLGGLFVVLCLSVSVYLNLSLSVCLSLFLCLCLSLFVSVCLCLCLSVCLPPPPSISVCFVCCD